MGSDDAIESITHARYAVCPAPLRTVPRCGSLALCGPRQSGHLRADRDSNGSHSADPKGTRRDREGEDGKRKGQHTQWRTRDACAGPEEAATPCRPLSHTVALRVDAAAPLFLDRRLRSAHPSAPRQGSLRHLRRGIDTHPRTSLPARGAISSAGGRHELARCGCDWRVGHDASGIGTRAASAYRDRNSRSSRRPHS